MNPFTLTSAAGAVGAATRAPSVPELPKELEHDLKMATDEEYVKRYNQKQDRYRAKLFYEEAKKTGRLLPGDLPTRGHPAPPVLH